MRNLALEGIAMKSSISLSAIALVLLAQFASGKILDLKSPANAVLDPLAPELHSKGIDVRRRWEAGPSAPGKRAVLTPLRGFISSSEAETARALWMQDFEGRIQSVLVGVKQEQPIHSKSTRAQLNLTEFKKAWERAPQSQRVFISFTRADAAYALDVKKSLTDRGFHTFVYLEGSNKAPTLTPREAGHFFGTAGHHFVIDTQNARRSSGVWFEKALLGRYGRAVSVNIDEQPPPSRPAVFTCTCNTYRNGVLVSSVEIPRGATCGVEVCG
jgi:hypothetical protein